MKLIFLKGNFNEREFEEEILKMNWESICKLGDEDQPFLQQLFQ